MIPAGYVASVVLWATGADLSDEVKAARKAILIATHDALISGQMADGKPVNSIISGGLNGKSFAFAPGITESEKPVVIAGVLAALGVLPAAGVMPTATYGNFSAIAR